MKLALETVTVAGVVVVVATSVIVSVWDVYLH